MKGIIIKSVNCIRCGLQRGSNAAYPFSRAGTLDKDTRRSPRLNDARLLAGRRKRKTAGPLGTGGSSTRAYVF